MNILKTNYRTTCVCKPVSITFHNIKIGQIHSTNYMKHGMLFSIHIEQK